MIGVAPLLQRHIDPRGNALAGSETADLKKFTQFLEDDYSGIDASSSTAPPRRRWPTVRPSQAGGALEQDPVALRRDDRARFWPAPPRHAQGHDPVHDVVKTMSGRFSGSALFIFSQLRQGVPLSEALVAACGKGLCEPEPP